MGSIFNVRLAAGDAAGFPRLAQGLSRPGRRHASCPARGLSRGRLCAEPASLLMGNEQQGLPDELAEACDALVKIPMARPGRFAQSRGGDRRDAVRDGARAPGARLRERASGLEAEDAGALDLEILQFARHRHLIACQALEPVERQIGPAGIPDEGLDALLSATAPARRGHGRRCRGHRRCRRRARCRRRGRAGRRTSPPIAVDGDAVGGGIDGDGGDGEGVDVDGDRRARRRRVRPRWRRGPSRRRNRARAARQRRAIVEEVAGERLAAGPGEGPEGRRQADARRAPPRSAARSASPRRRRGAGSRARAARAGGAYWRG